LAIRIYHRDVTDRAIAQIANVAQSFVTKLRRKFENAPSTDLRDQLNTPPGLELDNAATALNRGGQD
jgi:hypothetical protein